MFARHPPKSPSAAAHLTLRLRGLLHRRADSWSCNGTGIPLRRHQPQRCSSRARRQFTCSPHRTGTNQVVRMRRAAADTRRCTSATAQPPRPHLSFCIGPPLRRPMSWCTLCLSTSFRPISMSHLVIFAENASTSRRQFPYPPRAPNKASKATIADLRRYLVSHKIKDEREPCTPRDLAMSQNCNPAGPKTHRKISYTPGNNHRRVLFRYSSIPHLSSPPIQPHHRRTTYGQCGRSAPWLDGRTVRTKGSVTLPFLMNCSGAASHIHLDRSCGEIGFHGGQDSRRVGAHRGLED